MKLTESKLREMIREELLNEAASSYKKVFDYDTHDPSQACRSFSSLFDGADCGYSESGDSYGWNDDTNWLKATAEYHKEMFKIVDGYITAEKKAMTFWKTQEKIFKKWRKTDGSKWGS